eukprot:gene15000-17736_t
MTSVDFQDFRKYLLPASGFQSLQFRIIESKLGLLMDQRTKQQQESVCTALSEADRARLLETHKESSLLDSINSWLEKNPMLKHKDYDFWYCFQKANNDIVDQELNDVKNDTGLTDEAKKSKFFDIGKIKDSLASMFNETEYTKKRDRLEVRLSYKAFQSALMIFQHKDIPMFQMPFNILNELMNMEEQLGLWRYRHLGLVQRIIGSKIGSRGSTGVHYLRSTLNTKIFLDLFNLSSYLVERSYLPLPPKLDTVISTSF